MCFFIALSLWLWFLPPPPPLHSLPRPLPSPLYASVIASELLLFSLFFSSGCSLTVRLPLPPFLLHLYLSLFHSCVRVHIRRFSSLSAWYSVSFLTAPRGTFPPRPKPSIISFWASLENEATFAYMLKDNETSTANNSSHQSTIGSLKRVKQRVRLHH